MKRSTSFDGKVVWLVLVMSLAALAGACAMIDATDPTDGEAISEQGQEIGGPPPCSRYLENGDPNPDWPGCHSVDPPTPDCASYPACYSTCRTVHPCNTTPSQCNPLADCLDNCDSEFPLCH
jgi:hypothetical protein